MPVCEYHGELMEKMGELKANQINTQHDLSDIKKELARAVACMESVARTMQKEQMIRTIGKVTLWAGSVTGAIFLAEYVKACLK